MTAMAARAMGYRIQVLDPDPACPARFVVDGCIEAAWDDAHEAAHLAGACDVVTLEIEQIALKSLDAASKLTPVRPGRGVLEVIQDRIVQKEWLQSHGFPVGDWRAVRSLDELREAIKNLGGKVFCKSATGGYDGRGQGKVGFRLGADAEDELRGAWAALGEHAGVAEKAIELEREISVLVARSPAGEVKVYPAAWNHHENQILAWSVMPAPLTDAMAAEARELAERIANSFTLEGILAVEMFVAADGRLLVNELAPRPHNSYHASERASVTSQFEQLVRAVCDLPLGDVSVVQPCAIANLLGDVWLNEDGSPRAPHFDRALAVPGVRLHLYEKHRPRKGRKMGHLSAVGATADEAVAAVLRAQESL
ncbi:MAG: 5-(carboxyamino)imidazole ribonucleotide synthase [Acidobacteria bacterium]|nr:5-(carboxyamino)imidazole ribonucleotide synthase [Acidobacteriota bacterium]